MLVPQSPWEVLANLVLWRVDTGACVIFASACSHRLRLYICMYVSSGLKQMLTLPLLLQVVSLHCNLDASTMHLINAARLKASNPSFICHSVTVSHSALLAHKRRVIGRTSFPGPGYLR